MKTYAVLSSHASTAQPKLDGGCLDSSALITDTVASLAVAMDGWSIEVGSSGVGVVGSHRGEACVVRMAKARNDL